MPLWCWGSQSPLVHVMAYSVPSHHLNKCWHAVNWNIAYISEIQTNKQFFACKIQGNVEILFKLYLPGYTCQAAAAYTTSKLFSVEVRLWMNNHIPHVMMDVITYPLLNVSWTMSVKRYQVAMLPSMLACSVSDSGYHQTSNIRHTWERNEIVDHSDVVGASPVGATPTTSSFST